MKKKISLKTKFRSYAAVLMLFIGMNLSAIAPFMVTKAHADDSGACPRDSATLSIDGTTCSYEGTLTYYCTDHAYTPDVHSNLCMKYLQAATYTCSTGSAMAGYNGFGCYTTEAVTHDYTCTSGGSLSGSSCGYHVTETCSSPYSWWARNNACVDASTYIAAASNCSSGQGTFFDPGPSGTGCYQATAGTTPYTCPSGGSAIGTQCNYPATDAPTCATMQYYSQSGVCQHYEVAAAGSCTSGTYYLQGPSDNGCYDTQPQASTVVCDSTDAVSGGECTYTATPTSGSGGTGSGSGSGTGSGGTTTLDGITTISDSQPTTTLDVPSAQTISLDGSRGDTTVENGGTLKGNGSTGNLDVQTGAIVAPGHSPGCITSQDLTINGTYQAEIGGTTPCTGYDQLRATGNVDVTNGILATSLYGSFVPSVGDQYTIIDNEGSNPVTGTFTGMAEGDSFQQGGVTYTITYTGGDGNDVVLTVTDVDPSLTTAQQGADTSNDDTPTVPDTGFMLMSAHPFASLAISNTAALGLLFIARKMKFATQRF